MKAQVWRERGYERHIWRPIAEALSKGQHVAIDQPREGLGNVREACRGFYGFLVHVAGLSHKQSCRLDNLLSPRLLHAFWEFQATPQGLKGRGLARSTMRTMCNSVIHMLCACEALGVVSKEHPQCTPKACIKWWKAGGQKKTVLCPEGEKKTRARGHAQLWPEVQDVVKASMEEALEEADELEQQLLQGRLGLDVCGDDEMKDKLLAVQRSLLLGPAGITQPPLRPNCSPTLRQPKTLCTRQICSSMPLMRRVCPGNQLHVGGRDPVTKTKEYYIVWRHYKNSDKGGYIGSGQEREHTAKMHGPLWQSLQGHWQRWGRAEWMELCNVEEKDDPGYTYLDRSGRPWRSVETDTGHSCLSTFLREQLLQICTASERFTEEELASLETFTLQEARFTFAQHIERTLFKRCSLEERKEHKKKMCLCMLTSEEEWDKTYSSRKRHYEEEEEVCMDLREQGYLVG